jgi:uncharacterized protein YndB with AHSA1/START domain
MSQPAVIRCERRLKQSPAAVWKALTTPELMAKWWAPADIRAEVGHRFSIDMGKWGVEPSEVVEVEVEKRLVFRFVLDTTVAWDLTPEGEGTLLTMTHTGLDLDSPIARQAYEGMSKGWPVILEKLGTFLSA